PLTATAPPTRLPVRYHIILLMAKWWLDDNMKNIKKITNLKTVESDNKKNNRLSEVRAWKRKLLSSTDWITLPDVSKNITNVEDIVAWRKSVRKIEINKIEDIKSAEKELTYLEMNKVEP